MAAINGDWLEALKDEFKKDYYKQLFEKVNEEYRTRLIFPPANDIFNAFHLTPLKDVKVVIRGQESCTPNHHAVLCKYLQAMVVSPPPALPKSKVHAPDYFHDTYPVLR